MRYQILKKQAPYSREEIEGLKIDAVLGGLKIGAFLEAASDG